MKASAIETMMKTAAEKYGPDVEVLAINGRYCAVIPLEEPKPNHSDELRVSPAPKATDR